MSGVIVNYNNNQLTSMSSSGTKTLLTSGKYCENDFEVIYSAPTTSSLTVTPTETSQTFNATGVYGYKPVTVDAISSTYVGTGVTTRSAADLSIWQSRITAPSGYYSSNASIYMSAYDLQVPTTSFSQTTGTFVASCSISTAGYYGVQYGSKSQSLNTIAAQTIYPSTVDQTISSYRWLTGSQTIKSVTTTNLSAENIAEGVTVQVGDATNASRITQVTGAHSGLGSEPYRCYIISNENINVDTGVVYDGKTYNQPGSNFLFNASDSITLKANGTQGGGKIIIDGTMVASSAYNMASYSYIPGTNFDVVLTGHALATLSVNTYTPTSEISSGEYYGIYKCLATKNYPLEASGSSYYGYTASEISAWCDSIVSFPADQQFAGVRFNGSFTFNNLNTIAYYAFGSVYDGPITGNTSARADFYFPSVSYIYDCAFDYNRTVRFVSAPSCLTIGASTFRYGTNLTDISFPICTTIGGSAFQYCSRLTTVNFPSCTSIGGYAFQYCSGLTTISFPICTTISSSTFQSCYKLTAVDFPSCTSINNYTFGNCSSLTTANFPSCTSIGSSAFYNCSRLTTISFPICTTIGAYAFSGCSSLTTVNFPSCTSIGGWAFQYCSGLTTISFSICTTISNNVFWYCNSLTTASFPVCTTIGAFAFSGCSSLTTANFPSCTSIGSSAFLGCGSLTTVNFPSCTTIGAYAFSGCSSLTTISLPSCNQIGNYAFQFCFNLISLYLNQVSSVPTLGAGAFTSTPISLYSTIAGRYGSIFVPSSLYSSFITATNWKTYSARMVSV